MSRSHRVAGALIGSVIGDALGAPFEFGPPGRFSARFPEPARGVETEMCGGGGWQPGEFTDDTQMALLVAESLLDHDGLDEADLFHRFQRWLAAGPADVGIQTREVLGSGLAWDSAAAIHFERTGRAAGNGSLMRTTPAAIFFSRAGTEETMDAARRISALTHGDPSAGEGCAIFHELIRVALDGEDPLTVLPDVLRLIDDDKWHTVLADNWTPDQATEPNGAVWPTLGSAVWALRGSTSFEQVMRRVIDLGGDTDTLAAVAGGLAGALYGITGIPMRWASAVHGRLPGFTDDGWWLADLHHLAARLDGSTADAHTPDPTHGIEPVEVAPGLWAADLDGARASATDFAVISLCRTGGRFGHELHRFAYLTDDEKNPDVEGVVNDILDDIEALRRDGKQVLVHCHGGASRTGLVLRGWLVRTEGLGADEATARVSQKWPHLGLWNDGFTAALGRREDGYGSGPGVAITKGSTGNRVAEQTSDGETALTAAVDALVAAPLHAMSLASHELFFSNLLGWAAEQFPVESAEVWRPRLLTDGSQEPLRVRREWLNLDLVVEFPGSRPLVVENKSLSMPDEQQLERYDIKLAKAVATGQLREPTRVLLSPVSPGWPTGTLTTSAGGTWRWVAYGDLASRLAAGFRGAGTSYEAETVRRLAELMQRLQVVLTSDAAQPNLDQPLALTQDVLAELQRARVHHLVVKVRARHIGALVRDRLEEEGLARSIAVNTTMTRGMPLIEGLPHDPDGTSGTRDRLLWQIQGSDLRLAAVLPSLAGRTPSARAARETAADQLAEWFDFAPAQELLGERCGPPSTTWLRFDPDFVYRKVTVAGLSVGDVVKLGARYSALIAEAGPPEHGVNAS